MRDFFFFLLLQGTVLTTDHALFLLSLPKMATHFKEQLAHFHTSHLSWAGSQQRVKNVELSTYPLLTSMISPLEV